MLRGFVVAGLVVLGEAFEVEGDRCAHVPLYLLERFACRAAPGRSDEQVE
jgi:hypothetical protein